MPRGEDTDLVPAGDAGAWPCRGYCHAGAPQERLFTNMVKQIGDHSRGQGPSEAETKTDLNSETSVIRAVGTKTERTEPNQ